MRHEIYNYPGKSSVTLECFILDSTVKYGQGTKRPAIVICPGGGYVYLSNREGDPVAMAYANHGVHAFVLKYSIGLECIDMSPMKEIDWAIGLIREHADEWDVNPDQIISCGFSAGGHLAMASGLLGQNKPNAMILGYPATNLRMSPLMAYLWTGKTETTEEENRYMDLIPQITKDAPPLFLFTTGGDALTKGACIQIAAAYDKLGLPCEFHLFGKGPHGYSLATADSADGSSQVVDPHAAKWLELSTEWIVDTFGAPVLEDVSNSHVMEAIMALGLDLEKLFGYKG